MRKPGLIIGQAPAKPPVERPFGRTKLYAWFDTIGFDKARMDRLFDYDSLVADFPGSGKSGHLPPAPEKMKAYRPKLLAQVAAQNYQLIIPVGKMAVHAILDQAIELHDAVGREFIAEPFGHGARKVKIIPLPHPSGASTWAYKEENRLLLQQALRLIKDAASSQVA
jgi:uracil-DNA glycosylase